MKKESPQACLGVGQLHDEVVLLNVGEKKYFDLKEKERFINNDNLLNFELNNQASGCLIKGGY